MNERKLWDPVSDTFAQSRDHLHQLAFFAISPARYAAAGRMGLEPTPGGFGTPEFEGRVARVEGSQLVHTVGEDIATQQISTIREGATFFGVQYEPEWFADFHDPLQPMDPDVPLVVNPADTLAIGEWLAFGFEVLNRLRETGNEEDDVSEAQIWPEHFDGATELGNPDEGQRASYGVSPGDGAHPEPYIYVAAWGEIDRADSYWNDEAFNGASLSYSELAGSADPRQAALDFFVTGYRILHRSA